jgi:hypothetical protein
MPGYVQRSIDLSATPQRVIAARADRRYLLLQNIGEADAWIEIGEGGGQAVAGRGFRLAPCASLELRKLGERDPAPDGAVWASGAAGAVLVVIEG